MQKLVLARRMISDTRLQVQGFHLRPEAGRKTEAQVRQAPQIRRRIVIAHLKLNNRMDRNYPWYRQGDAANAVLTTASYDFRHFIHWVRFGIPNSGYTLRPPPN
ncbi:hypothetical protein LMTR13_25365 [Bradyrhizobium icense]|uniref:Uncharacterized protein n=2 Tax=Bradyrhizobium icense TaxID=1274631 RepID=A0A1B1UJM1_9BRAD|nr:hypothetical protein LMTR13_25365 [Bradyrhizobium icense]